MLSLGLTFVLFVLIFGVIIMLHEAGHFFVAKREGMKVREFAFGFPPRLFTKRKGGTQFSINLLPLGGYVSIEGEDEESTDPNAFSKKSPWARLRVVLAGVTMNVLLAWVLLTVYLWVAPLLTPKLDAVVVASVMPGSAAEAAGLQVNDFLTHANGEPIVTDEALTEFTRDHRGETIAFQLRRNGSEQTVSATLGSGETAPLGVSVVDVAVAPEVPWYLAPWYAVLEIVNVTMVTLGFIGTLIAKLFGFAGQSDVSVAQVSGPVGIFSVLQQVQILGVPAILHFSAMISLAVGIFNLLPFPALDGGRAVLLFFEGIFKKRALSHDVEAWLHTGGFAILILLILVVTYFDIQKLG